MSYKEMMEKARPKFYDMDTQPLIDHMQWVMYGASLMETGEKSLAHDIVGNYRVSTVYIGLDMGFMNVLPLIFETMIFVEESKEDNLGINLWMDRYTWKEQALQGHERALRLARGEISLEESGGC